MQNEDSTFRVSGLLEERDSGFYLRQQPHREIPFANTWHNALTIEVSLDKEVYSRTVYNGLDYASDLGGLFSAVYFVFRLTLDVVNLYSSYQFVMGDVFHKQASVIVDEHDREKPEQNEVQKHPCQSLKLSFKTFAPKSCRCCCLKSGEQERRRIKALRHVIHEVQISRVIRQLRILNAVARQGKTDKEWARFRQRHSMLTYSDLDSASSALTSSKAQSMKKLDSMYSQPSIYPLVPADDATSEHEISPERRQSNPKVGGEQPEEFAA